MYLFWTLLESEVSTNPRNGEKMESLLKSWNGETVIIREDKETKAWIFIAIYSTRLGPAAGGTRMKSYPSLKAALEDAMLLAKAMAYKYAVPNMPWGGGKCVIAIPEDLDPDLRPGLLRRYGALVKQLGGMFYTGPDMGTCSEDMDIIAETGAPYIFACTPKSGGSGSSGPYTAMGVLAGIKVACKSLFGSEDLKDRKILVQGVGSVGGPLVELLLNSQAQVIFTEIDESLIQKYRDEIGLEFVLPERSFDVQCDVFSPCAIGGILTPDTARKIKCQAIVGGANNQLESPEVAEILQRRGILYAPDYVVNVGGAMAILGMETLGWSKQQAEEDVRANVGRALENVFHMAQNQGMTTEAAANMIAENRLRA